MYEWVELYKCKPAWLRLGVEFVGDQQGPECAIQVEKYYEISVEFRIINSKMINFTKIEPLEVYEGPDTYHKTETLFYEIPKM